MYSSAGYGFSRTAGSTCMIIQRAAGFLSVVVNRWDLKGRMLLSTKHNLQTIVSSWDVLIKLRGFSSFSKCNVIGNKRYCSSHFTVNNM